MADWTNEQLYGGTDSVDYNEALITYNEIGYQYNGFQQTIWTEETLEVTN